MLDPDSQVDYQSIAVWLATGFFFDDNTFLSNSKEPQSKFGPDIVWHHTPRKVSFSNVIKEFSDLFELLIKNNTKSKKIILPLSGGLDSRTLAAALSNRKEIKTYSYEFESGVPEIKYAQQIANNFNWKFKSFTIPHGYLWNKIDSLSNINRCQVEFTHPRQMAFINEIADLGDIIISGQWGDVLFDTPGIKNEADIDEQTNFLIKKIAKPGGIELAEELWKYWELTGDFYDIFYKTVKNILLDIDIKNPNSRIRAFKSLQWTHRWANNNLKIFSNYKEIYIPYYSKEMCEFICTLPEEYLSNRKIQIEYIKRRAPKLAEIPWQEYDLDLYKYKYFNSLYFYKRIFRYANRIINEIFFKINPKIERNWELQFLGESNENYLKQWLFEVPELNDLISSEIVKDYYNKFKKDDSIKYSHPISMLLTLSVWCKKFWKKS